jgi:hypothetical protein
MLTSQIPYDKIFKQKDPILTTFSMPGFWEETYSLYKDQKDVVALVGKKQASFLFRADTPNLFSPEWCFRTFKNSNKIQDCSIETSRGTIGYLESQSGVPLEIKCITGNGFTESFDNQKRIITQDKKYLSTFIHSSRKEISTPEGLSKIICQYSKNNPIASQETQEQIKNILEDAFSKDSLISEISAVYRDIAQYVFYKNPLTVLASVRLFQRKDMKGVFRYVAR